MGLCEGEMRSSSRVLRTVPGTHSKLSVNGGQATVSITTILLPFFSYVEDVSSHFYTRLIFNFWIGDVG